MADVLFVCVREDVAQAEALAEMFHAVGFSIGDSAFNMHAHGACVVIWTPAAVRSRAFRIAAERALRAPNTVLATLGPPPTPFERTTVPMFDLSGWGGDRDDALLDPLFFFVERMVVAAREADLLVIERKGAMPVEAEFGDHEPEDDVALLEAPVAHVRRAPPREILVNRWDMGCRQVRQVQAMRAFAFVALIGGAALFTSLNLGANAGAHDAQRINAGVVSAPSTSKLGGVNFSDIVEAAPEDAAYDVIAPDLVETFGVAGVEPPSAESALRRDVPLRRAG